MKRMPALLTAILLSAASLFAQNDVGEVNFANSGAPAAQASFRRGLALLHNFEYPFAIEAFREAQKTDPDFAMAYWGEAMAHTWPIWFQQDADAARTALKKLGATPEERLAKAKTERERDYLRAVDVLYGEGTKNERDFKYLAAMEALHARYPDDVDAAAFHALALLGSAHKGRDFATYMRSAAILEEIFPQNRRHPGVLHYLIHSYDDPVHAPLGLRAARLYGDVAPQAGHALHMTSHIFIGLGMWKDVIAANRRAIDVVNQQRAARNKQKADCGHYPTWLHYGFVQVNDVAAARAALDACRNSALVNKFESAGKVDTKEARVEEYTDMRAHHVASGFPLTANDQVAIPDGDEFLVARYTATYADALYAGQRGDVEGLKASIQHMGSLLPLVVEKTKNDDNPSARMRAEVMLQESEALVLVMQGKRAEAIAKLELAAKTEGAMPYEFGPPLVAKPAAEMLGDQLAAAGRLADAEEAYKSALARVPGRTVLISALERVKGSGVKQVAAGDKKTNAPHCATVQ